MWRSQSRGPILYNTSSGDFSQGAALVTSWRAFLWCIVACSAYLHLKTRHPLAIRRVNQKETLSVAEAMQSDKWRRHAEL